MALPRFWCGCHIQQVAAFFNVSVCLPDLNAISTRTREDTRQSGIGPSFSKQREQIHGPNMDHASGVCQPWSGVPVYIFQDLKQTRDGLFLSRDNLLNNFRGGRPRSAGRGGPGDPGFSYRLQSSTRKNVRCLLAVQGTKQNSSFLVSGGASS